METQIPHKQPPKKAERVFPLCAKKPRDAV